MGLRVAIVGAGLGGLCLAQGLLREGVEVTLYERDVSLDGRRQGYRLHLDARAGLALARCDVWFTRAYLRGGRKATAKCGQADQAIRNHITLFPGKRRKVDHSII